MPTPGSPAASQLLSTLAAARYDLLLCCGVLLTLVFWRRGWKNGCDIVVITACHGVGLAFEIVKVHLGSWSYPEPAVRKFAGCCPAVRSLGPGRIRLGAQCEQLRNCSWSPRSPHPGRSSLPAASGTRRRGAVVQ
ncbi:DUF817 family protein [Kitasatospora sp. NPDC127035]|uniref:DUF817 family protein n=1 Tax=Kitasatospora sp. NPDC127035 TaxID=3347111 RepID=UPI00365BC8CD